MHALFTYFHILSGTLMLLVGGYLLFAPGKGNRRHKQLGKVFALSTSGVVLSAVLIMVFFRFSPFLFAIAIFSGYMCFSGYRVLRRKKQGSHTALDWSVAVVTAISGIALLIYGILLLQKPGLEVLAYLSIGFAVAITHTAYRDIRVFLRKKPMEKMWWWYQHMGNMGGAWIASLTAFLVQNGGRFFPGFEQQWIFWVAPGVAYGVAMTIWVGKYRRKFNPA